MSDAIQQLAEPCWHLRLPNGDEPFLGDWNDSHYHAGDEAAKAAKWIAAGYSPPPNLVPARLDAPCYEARAVCGYRHDEGEEGVEHWPDRESLLNMLLHCGWKPVEGGGMTCGSAGCDECDAMTVVAAPAEMPGQMPLIGADQS